MHSSTYTYINLVHTILYLCIYTYMCVFIYLYTCISFTAANVLFSILCCSGQTFALVRCGLDTAHFLCCIVVYLLDLQQYHGHWSSWANCKNIWADLPLNVVDVRLADSKNIWIGKLYMIKFLTPPQIASQIRHNWSRTYVSPRPITCWYRSIPPSFFFSRMWVAMVVFNVKICFQDWSV